MPKEICFIYLKKEGIEGPCELELREILEIQKIEILYTKSIFIDIEILKIHQPILFDLRGDLDDFWKTQSVERLRDTTVKAMLVSAEDAIRRCDEIKKYIRNKYTKPCAFDRETKISYPNYMHASSTKEEIERDVAILMPEKLQLVRRVNGIKKDVSCGKYL